jgi:hypothetical protein
LDPTYQQVGSVGFDQPVVQKEGKIKNLKTGSRKA